MSNEELVQLIRAGEAERMADLWEQVRLFVIKQARRVPLEGRADVELDDLIQSGYLAMVDAVAVQYPHVTAESLLAALLPGKENAGLWDDIEELRGQGYELED